MSRFMTVELLMQVVKLLCEGLHYDFHWQIQHDCV